MLKILADTSTNDFLIALIQDDKCLDYVYIKQYLKKTDIFPCEFKKLLKKNNVKIQDIQEYYCTNGPGSFTGAKTAFIFLKTICIIQEKKLFLSNSLAFLAASQKQNQIIKVDAKSDLQYIAIFKRKLQLTNIMLEPSCGIFTEFDIKDFLENIRIYLSTFTNNKNIFDTNVYYVKNPSIGKVK